MKLKKILSIFTLLFGCGHRNLITTKHSVLKNLKTHENSSQRDKLVNELIELKKPIFEAQAFEYSMEANSFWPVLVKISEDLKVDISNHKSKEDPSDIYTKNVLPYLEDIEIQELLDTYKAESKFFQMIAEASLHFSRLSPQEAFEYATSQKSLDKGQRYDDLKKLVEFMDLGLHSARVEKITQEGMARPLSAEKAKTIGVTERDVERHTNHKISAYSQILQGLSDSEVSALITRIMTYQALQKEQIIAKSEELAITASHAKKFGIIKNIFKEAREKRS